MPVRRNCGVIRRVSSSGLICGLMRSFWHAVVSGSRGAPIIAIIVLSVADARPLLRFGIDEMGTGSVRFDIVAPVG